MKPSEMPSLEVLADDHDGPTVLGKPEKIDDITRRWSLANGLYASSIQQRRSHLHYVDLYSRAKRSLFVSIPRNICFNMKKSKRSSKKEVPEVTLVSVSIPAWTCSSWSEQEFLSR